MDSIVAFEGLTPYLFSFTYMRHSKPANVTSSERQLMLTARASTIPRSVRIEPSSDKRQASPVADPDNKQRDARVRPFETCLGTNGELSYFTSRLGLSLRTWSFGRLHSSIRSN